MANIYELKNGNAAIRVLKKGAELVSYKVDDTEFIWEGDPKFWAAHSPILFPIVGSLLNHKYTFEGKEYEITTRHGFAKLSDFELSSSGEDYLEFLLSSNEETLKCYPFEFDFFVKYVLKDNGKLKMKFRVVNKNSSDMYFSIGAHPAFALEVNDDIKLSDYYIEFEKKETAGNYVVNGLYIDNRKEARLEKTDRLYLSDTIFDKDALAFDDIKSQEVTIKCEKHKREVKVQFEDFPYLAFWSKPTAPYVCIEPWYGITDMTDASGNIVDKAGIVKLAKDSEFKSTVVIKGKP